MAAPLTTVENCLAEFALRPDASKIQHELAKHIGVPRGNVVRWFKKVRNPRGSDLIRLRCHLEEKGIRLAEMDTLNPLIRDLVSLYSKGSVDLETIVSELGFSGKHPDHHAVRFMLGHSGLSRQKYEKLEQLIKKHVPKRTAANAPRSESAPLSPSDQNVFDQTEVLNRKTMIEVIAYQVKAAFPLVDAFEKNASKKERDMLLKLTGDDMRKLANRYHRLAGSEKARAELQRQP